MECQVCLEVSKKNIVCFCGYQACVKCVKTYLESQEDDKCMKCNVKWTTVFMHENFTKSYMNKEWKLKRQNILFQREQNLIPETLEAAKTHKRLKDLKQLKKSIQTRLDQEKDKLQRKYVRQEMKTCIFRIRETLQEIHSTATATTSSSQPRYTIQCPKEGCKGLMNIAYRCDLCDTKACSKCREEKNESHTCNPDILLTVQSMKNEVKGCPGCKKPIYKISGCNQMFCAPQYGGCGILFDWVSLKRETKAHNPHYYEWQRLNSKNGEIPRVEGDRCNAVNDLFATDSKLNKYEFGIITDIRRFAVQYLEHERKQPLDNEDIRIRFILNEISEKQFKSLLTRREKNNNYRTELNQILQMFEDVSLERLISFSRDSNISHLVEIKTLITYVDTQLQKLQTLNGYKVWSISENWTMMMIKITYAIDFFNLPLHTRSLVQVQRY